MTRRFRSGVRGRKAVGEVAFTSSKVPVREVKRSSGRRRVGERGIGRIVESPTEVPAPHWKRISNRAGNMGIVFSPRVKASRWHMYDLLIEDKYATRVMIIEAETEYLMKHRGLSRGKAGVKAKATSLKRQMKRASFAELPLAKRWGAYRFLEKNGLMSPVRVVVKEARILARLEEISLKEALEMAIDKYTKRKVGEELNLGRTATETRAVRRRTREVRRELARQLRFVPAALVR